MLTQFHFHEDPPSVPLIMHPHWSMGNARTSLVMAHLPPIVPCLAWPEPLTGSPRPFASTWYSGPSPAWYQSAFTSMSPILFYLMFIHQTKCLKVYLKKKKIHPKVAFNSIVESCQQNIKMIFLLPKLLLVTQLLHLCSSKCSVAVSHRFRDSDSQHLGLLTILSMAEFSLLAFVSNPQNIILETRQRQHLLVI